MGVGATAYYIKDSVDTNSALSISTTRVGIATAAPSEPLEISDAGGASISLLRNDATITADETLGQVLFKGVDSGGGTRIGAYIQATASGAWTADLQRNPSQLSFHTQADDNDSTLAVPRMIIDTNGKVRIGATIGTLPIFAVADDPEVDGDLQYIATIINNTTNYNSSPKTGLAFEGEKHSNGTYTPLAGIQSFKASAVSGNTGGKLQFCTKTEGAPGDMTLAMTIDENQRLGIGTASPDTPLHISDNTSGNSSYAVMRLEHAGTTIAADEIIGSVQFEGQDSGSAGVMGSITVEAENTSGLGRMHFYTGSGGADAKRMTILGGGNVGIGTDAPGETLSVTGTCNITGVTDIGGVLYAGAGAVFNDGAADVDFRIETENQSKFFFIDGANDKLRIGYGTELDQLVHIVGSGAAGAYVKIQNPTYDCGIQMYTDDSAVITVYDDTGGAAAGGINWHHATGNTTFYVGGLGGSHDRIVFESNNVNPTVDDSITLGTDALEYAAIWATTNAVSSDERLKENIQDLSGSGLEKINALKPRTFDWKKRKQIKDYVEVGESGRETIIDKGSNKIGFIAQEVQSIIPEIVTKGTGKNDFLDENENILIAKGDKSLGLSMSGNTMTAYMVKAIQELSAKVEALENA